ncbi:hypothetical protein B0H19DRAFT_1070826 [Mycena capillaripes]|nr:hypothetical protein B0H19DRAFT_1070826 [Mycena capillaripes]
MSSDSPRERFNKSAEAFRTAQTKMISHRQSNVLPGLEVYLSLRRDLSGILMVFDLIEMAEGLKITWSERWDVLKRSAADIIALSQDVFAYNNDQFIDNKFNIVSIVQAERGVSIQGAINYAFSLIDQSFRNFIAAEAALVVDEPVLNQATPGWAWNPLSRKQASAVTLEHVTSTDDSRLYLHGLKDCVVGTLNWSYETELYFGSKGDEIRQFGWLFLKVRDGGEKRE